jgi:L-gulonate 5-dehydrogenase
MHAAVFQGPFDLRLEERSPPRPGRGEALVRVRAVGVSETDLAVFAGREPEAAFPLIGGQEIAGTVAELGPDVDGPDPGTDVVVEPFVSCGRCYPCRVGKLNACVSLQVIGLHRDGGFSGFVAVPADRLHQVPRAVPPARAVFAEPVARAIQVCRRADIGRGDMVLILGARPSGMVLAEVARAHGAMVYVSDADERRLPLAVGLGARPIAAPYALADEVMRITGGEGMPVVVETTGSVRAMESAAGFVAAGGRLVFTGGAKAGSIAGFPGLDFTRKELTLIGARASVDCFPAALDFLARGLVSFPDLATVYPFADAAKVFAHLVEGGPRPLKAVFAMPEAERADPEADAELPEAEAGPVEEEVEEEEQAYPQGP